MSGITLNISTIDPHSERSANLYVIEGEIPYSVAWQWQQRLVLEYKSANPIKTASSDTKSPSGAVNEIHSKDSLILLQHPPVYTLGQGADTRFLRFDPHQTDIELYRIERGGEVTYHCPGQLVGYPILNLHYHRLDLHWYLRALEEVLIRTLACYGLCGERIEGLTGVWLKGHKVAAIGIKVSRWITMHGFALNICPDLTGFEKIVPCGLAGKRVGSMAQFLPEVSFTAVQSTLIEQFEQVFDLTFTTAPLSNLQCLDSSSSEAKVGGVT